MNTCFALIDCNNFYASCERLFRPDLINKPIVVLSNNDGCTIARSNEAKALGIKMGEPYFKIKNLCQQHGVHVFSSNYTLYGDISNRVMQVIQEYWPHVEVYSIDEAWLDLSSLPEVEREAFCQTLQRRVLKHIGMPTSIGIAPTKTLAKLANYIGKKKVNIPVFTITPESPWLACIDIGDVWGVGRKLEKSLQSMGIITAAKLAAFDKAFLKKKYSVVLMRTAMELLGIPCMGLELSEPKQRIMSSRSFGTMQTEYDALAQAISSHCARAYEKLRQDHLVVQGLTVFIQSNRHRRDLPQYNNSMSFSLVNASDDLRLLTTIAKRCLKTIFKTGFSYKKVGVCFDGLITKNACQLDLFNQLSPEALNKKEQVLSVMDAINSKFGRNTLRLAAEGHSKPWAMRAELKSPAYTTRWEDLLRVKNLT